MLGGREALERQAAIYGAPPADDRPPEREFRVERDQRVEQLRVPPQSVDAEQAVLGGLMLAPDALANVRDLLDADDFYRRDHGLIFHAICELARKERPFDAVTLGEWFESTGQAELVAGGAYLIELASTTPSAANIRAYAEIVRDKAMLRALIQVSTDSVNEAFESGGREASEVVSAAAARVANLTLRHARTEGGLRFVRNFLTETWDEIAARYEGTADVGLVPPWENVAALLPGLESTDYMLVAARPAMGKTIVGLEFADHAASLGRNVALFSLEMASRQLTSRLLSRRARVDSRKLRMKGALDEEDWPSLTRAMRELKELPLALDDTATLTIEALTARAQRMHAKTPGGLGLVVIDYVQLIEGSSGGDKRVEELSRISRGLKLLAKTLRCPVIALSQLNRSLETRTDKRPKMSDLRESGALEQDADIIAMLYRDDYYHPNSPAQGITEFIIGKQRQGPTGTAYLRHRLEYSTFEDHHGPAPSYGRAGSNDDDSWGEIPPSRPRTRKSAGTGSRGKDRAAGEG